MADYRVDVDVNVNDSKLDALEKKINNLKSKDVEVDVKVSDTSVKNLNSVIKDKAKNQTVVMKADSSNIQKTIVSVNTALKNASKSGKIKLDFDDNGAIKGINNIRQTYKNGVPIAVRVEGVDKAGNAFTAVKSLIGDIEKNPVDIKINTKSLDQTRTSFQQTQADCKELISTIKQIGSIRVQLQGLDAGSKQAEKLTSDLENLKAKAHNLFNSNNFGEIQMADISKATDKIESDLENAKNKIIDVRAEAAKGIEIRINNGDMTKDFAKMSDQIHKLGYYSNEVEAEFNDLMIKSKELSNALNSVDSNKIIKANEAYINSLDKLENKIKTVSSVKKRADELEKDSAAQAKLRQDADTVYAQIGAWLKNNSAAEKDFGSQLRALQVQLRSCDAVQFNNLKSQFNQIKLAAEQVGKTGLNFKDRLQMQFTRLAGYFGASGAIMYSIQGMREMFQNVLDVDTQLTELYRVTDLTSTQYTDLYDSLIGSAQEYGAVLTDLISATADWSRAGFDPETAAGLAEVTSIYQHISDLDYDEASENLLTAYKGFESELKESFSGDAVEAVSYVSDILNELDNNYAVTAAGVGEAMKRSASAMSVAGNTIQETAGMITGITEVTQDPEKAGNALKVVSMRLRGMKGGLEELGEEVDDNVTNLSKMQGQILEMTHGKVNIFDDTGEFKSTYEILQGIAEVWDTLSSTDQAELLETVAGKHRANDVAAIFQNWEHVEAATKSATEATGSAAAENEKYANSMQGHLDKLTSKWQEFSNTAADSGFLKGIVQFGTDALGALDAVIDKLGLFPTLLTAAGAAFSLSGKGMWKTVKDEAGNAHIEISDKVKKIASSVKTAFSGIGQVLGESFNSINTKLGGGNVFNYNKSSLSGTGFLPSLNNDISKLKEYQKLMNSAKESGKDFDVNKTIFETMSGSSRKAQDFAKTFDGSKESLQAFAEECLNANGVISGSAKSFTNVRRIISEYNNIVDKTGNTQKNFANVISAANPSLGNYLSGLNGAGASLGKYAVQLGVATIKTVALQAASLALNAALSLGIGLLIGAAVQGIMNWINAADELSDKVKDVTQNYKNQKEELNKNKQTIDDISESYEKLSQGVNTSNNNNVSLSTDEYKEYCTIVNQIADMFPTLVSGYDAQGNAILTCAGSVEKLNDAYREAAGNNYDDVLKDASSIFDDFENKKKDIDGGNLFGDSWLWDDNKMHKDSYEALKKTLETNDNSDLGEKITKYITSNADTRDEIAKAFEDSGIHRSLTEGKSKFINRAIKENPKVAKQIVSDFENEMKSAVEGMQTAAESYIGKAFLDGDYSKISDNMQEVISNIIPNLGFDYFSQFDNVTDLYKSLDDMLGSFNSLNDGDKKTFETYFDLQSKVNNGNCTVGEYVSNLDDVGKAIDNLDVDEETKKALKLSFQLDDNDIKKQYDSFVNKLVDAGRTKDAAKKLVGGLTSTELKAAVKLEAEGKIDLKKINLNDLKSQIEKEAKYLSAMNFTIDVEGETESLEKFNSALAEARTGSGLTQESFEALEKRYKSLDNYDGARLFEETANGLSLNAQAVSEYEKALADTKLDETNSNLDALKNKYNDLTNDIRNCSDATKKAQLINEQEDVRKKITELAELATMYEGLTSSYNEWQNAENAGNNRDMYQNIYSAQENIKKELDNGWIDDGTKEYFQLIWGEDKWDGAGKSVEDYRNKWATLDDTIEGTSYSINDFFKTNEDGELTSEGIFNFFDAVGQKQKELGEDWIQYDENGNMKSFNFGVDGDKAVADAMGISEELVQIFMRASQDCGFVVNFDGTYTQLADLQNEATAAQNRFNEIFDKDYSFNFNTQSLSEAKSDLEEAKKLLDNDDFWNHDDDGKRTTFNFDAKGATEAMQMVSTLQAMVDNLDNKYIGLTVEDKDFEEPLEKLQDYETKVAQLNQLKLDPQANTEEIEKLESDLDGIVNYFDQLSDEEKIKVGIETDDSPDEIKSKIESGEIKIPTTLDIQTKMSKSLEDLVDLGKLNSGMLSEEEKLEIKVRLGIATDEEQAKAEAKKAVKNAKEIIESVEKSVKLSDTGRERATKFFEENEYARNYDRNQQVNTVKLVADWSGIDNYKVEDKQAVVEFIKDVDDIESYRLDQKQAIVDFVVENKDILNDLGLDGEQKKIVLDFALKNPDFLDGLDDGQKKIAVEYVAKNPNFFDGLDDKEKKIAVDFIAKNPDFLDNLGLNDSEKKIAIDFIAKNQDIFNELDDEDKKVAIEYIAKNPDVLDGLSDEQKQVAVKFTADTKDIDKYTPEQLTAIVNFVKDSSDIDSYTPEQKNAIAKYAVDGGDVNSYQPEDRAAIVKFLTNSVDPDSYTPEQKQAIAKFLKDSGEVDGYQPGQKEAIARFRKDSSEPDSYQPANKSADAIYTASMAPYTPPTLYGTIKYTAQTVANGIKNIFGGGGVDGTAHANGTAYANGTTGKAFAQGNWGTKDSGVALGGELGTELLVRDGRWYTIGEDSAEFFGYKKGDIIFNADQTKEIFEKGKITHGSGRGKALADGTAFSRGSGASNPWKSSGSSSSSYKSSSKSSSSSSSSSSNSSDDADDFEETLDWIEIKISRIERAISKLDLKASSVYKKWSTRNAALADEIGKVSEEIDIQSAGADRYLQQANSIGLSEEYASKVRNGTIDIETIYDEDLKDKISDYQTW
jgi:TP901 family phage tail tape measure protein